MWRFRRSLQTTMLAAGIVMLATYLLLFDRSSQLSDKDIVVDIAALERELENDKYIDSVTYKPPKADSIDQNPSPNNQHQILGDTYARTMKFHKIWAYANKAINIHELFADTPDVETVLEALATARIVSVDILDVDEDSYESGTAAKWVVVLEGGQKAMMKLVWQDKMDKGKGMMKENALCNYGFEMPASEIAAFHLHRVLGFRNTPYVVGRVVDLAREILPVASPVVAKQITVRDNKTCVTGRCFFCDKDTTMCPVNGLVEASVSYWVPKHLKLYTFPPKYMPFSTTRVDEWGGIAFNNHSYCKKVKKMHPYDVDRYYHDLFDFAVIDTLMYHFDSKHYLIQDGSDAHGLTVRLDHGRAFCAHDRDDDHIFLAPIFQCCMLRHETWWSLDSFRRGLLTRRLKQDLSSDPIAPILLEDGYFTAIDRRLDKIIKVVENCAKANGGWEKILVG